ncbi:hypothetical protein D4764_10G0006490 [Takifugu flavidus]|uniref:Uncharacterized protein n=1 Tax=Takifugu flavidus TaxID=433684 RepID=A0A5C6PL23_9TELE|nr:hypothetical protein D4764_10G0006490 [Takifugu flavidus]
MPARMCQMCRQAAVLKDLKERDSAGREERSNWRSARGKHANSKNILPSRALSRSTELKPKSRKQDPRRDGE